MGICKTPHSGTNTQDTNWQTGTSKSLTALSDGILYVQLRRNDTANIAPSDIPTDVFMLERGVVPTQFAPYFTPIELCKIGTYQDYIWNDGGTWKIHKETGKVVLKGNENWTESGYTNASIYSVYGGDSTITNSPLVSSEFTYIGTVGSQRLPKALWPYKPFRLVHAHSKMRRIQTARQTKGYYVSYS